MNEESRQDLIDRILRGEEVMAEGQDPQFSADVALERDICQAIGWWAMCQRLMDQWEHQAEESEAAGCYGLSEKPSARRQAAAAVAVRRRRPVALGIVAGVAACLAAGYVVLRVQEYNSNKALQVNRESVESEPLAVVQSVASGEGGALRSASPTAYIAELIEEEQYATALEAINCEMGSMDEELQLASEAAGSCQGPSGELSAQREAAEAERREQIEYMRALQADMSYELRWLQIRALVGLERTDEARTLLQAFVQDVGKLQDEAKNLLQCLGN